MLHASGLVYTHIMIHYIYIYIMYAIHMFVVAFTLQRTPKFLTPSYFARQGPVALGQVSPCGQFWKGLSFLQGLRTYVTTQ